MATPIKHFWPCIEVICESVNNRQKITYAELADKLGLELAKQEWSALLDLVAGKMKRELGDDFDLTWNVVYTSDPAKGLGRYFSNGDKAPGSTLLNPKDSKQVAEYERRLKEIYQHVYGLQKIEGKARLTKMARCESADA